MAGEQGGLLAFLNTPEGQGLLAGAFGGLAGARRGQPINSIGRAGMAGLAGYTNAQDQEQKLAQDAQRNKMFDLQMQQHQVALAQSQKAQEQAGMRQSYLGSVGKVTSPMVGAAPNQFDPMAWLARGGSVDDAKALAGSGNWGKSAIKDYKEVRTPDGVQIVGFDEFGQQLKTGATPFKAPEVRDFGGYVGGIDPITGKVSKYGDKSMSPDAKASNAVAWAGVQNSRDRLNFDKQGKAEFKDGQWVMPPKDMKPGETRQLSAVTGSKDANDALALIQQARAILPDATGSYGGYALDQGARFFGQSTKGAKAGSQLQAIEGALVAKMPKMSGPQSDKDVAMYKQMAGVVGDATIPVEQRQAALDVVEEIQRRYASGQGGQPQPKLEPARSPTGLRFMGFE